VLAAAYEHAYDLVLADGEVGSIARRVPLTVDGLIYASSMVMLDSARGKMAVPALSRWLFSLGDRGDAANVARGPGHGPTGAGGRVACGSAGRLLQAPHGPGCPRLQR
jgi:hypothetical protein